MQLFEDLIKCKDCMNNINNKCILYPGKDTKEENTGCYVGIDRNNKQKLVGGFFNTIKEDIERLKLCSTNQCNICGRYEKEECMLERNRCEQHILSDYKKLLKENEQLRTEVNSLKKENEELNEKILDNSGIYQLGFKDGEESYIKKVKDIIDRIDYDIKKTKEIISKNTNIYASYRKNDYQIVRLRAMNTKSLDIKKRLQELLESEE